MAKKTGRPQKVSKEEKLAIVEQYYVCHAGENSSVLAGHGLYSRLAEFAKTLGYQLAPYDFSRDGDIKNHIAKLCSCTEPAESCEALPVYEPLDITALMNRSQARIRSILQEREMYYRSLHVSAAQAIESRTLLLKKVNRLQTERKAAEEKQQLQESENKNLLRRLNEAEKKVAYLTRIIRKNVEPERAQQFLAGMTSSDEVLRKVHKTVFSSMDSLSKEDRQMKADAADEIDRSSLDSLLSLV